MLRKLKILKIFLRVLRLLSFTSNSSFVAIEISNNWTFVLDRPWNIIDLIVAISVRNYASLIFLVLRRRLVEVVRSHWCWWWSHITRCINIGIWFIWTTITKMILNMISWLTKLAFWLITKLVRTCVTLITVKSMKILNLVLILLLSSYRIFKIMIVRINQLSRTIFVFQVENMFVSIALWLVLLLFIDWVCLIWIFSMHVIQ